MTLSREAVLAAFEADRAVAIVRTDTAEQALAAAEACLAGGLRCIEVTFTVPGATGVLRQLARRGDAVVGAGSVLEAAQAREAAAAGASFVVTPHLDPALLGEIRAAGLACAMGALTPTEALACHRAGADLVKVFPASQVGGPAYVKALREPMPFLRLLPTGGIDAGNAAAYLDAGAFALGLGGGVVDRRAAAEGRFDVVRENAARVLAAVRSRRGPTARTPA